MKGREIGINMFAGCLCFIAIVVMILTFIPNGLNRLAGAMGVEFKFEKIEEIKTLCNENEKMSGAIISLMDENNLYDRNSNISHWSFSTPIFYRTLKYIAMNGNHSKDIYKSWIVKLKKENKSMKLARKNIEFSINYKKTKNQQ